MVSIGSIIVVTRVGLGKIARTKTPLCFSQDSQALIENVSFTHPDYVLYYLSQTVQLFKHTSRSTTISGVTKKQLSQLTLPLPPQTNKKEVSKIESIFGRIDAEHNFAIFVTVFSYKTKSTCLHPICSSDLQLTPLQSQELISGYLKFHPQEFLALAGFLNHLMTRLLARICLVKSYLSLLYHHTNMI